MEKIRTAVILAAGLGMRLQPITLSKPKCLVKINGEEILTHTLNALSRHGYKEVIIVTGFKANLIEKFITENNFSLTIRTIHNKDYDSTNNIYSLWLAKSAIKGAFTLIESDLIMEPHLYQHFTEPDKIALDTYDTSIHSGTTATVTPSGNLDKLFVKTDPPDGPKIYKTVNMYSFSDESWQRLRDEMDKLIEAGKKNIFYEKALARLVENNSITLDMVDFTEFWWDEVDTPEDLERVNRHVTTLAENSK